MTILSALTLWSLSQAVTSDLLGSEAVHLVSYSAAHLADVLLLNWRQSRSAALDVHVISPL